MSTPDHQRVFEVFSRVCDMPAGERTAAIAEACGGDDALRAAVQALIRADQDAPDALDDRAIDSGEHLRDHHPTAPPSIPDRIGRFKIIRLIGEGGMGSVYEAEQGSPSRRVAMKVIRAGAVSRQALARFRREAEVLGLLQHPGIAQIFESGTHDGQPYIAMELVDGPDLKRYAADHGLSTRAKLELIARVTDAVHHAHQKGVLHRDLKPENVLVTPSATTSISASGALAEFAELGQPKVLDFGIARATDGMVDVTATRTMPGQLIGTLAYMSPEQLAGERDIDVRADVFALGMIAFELLSGSLPTRIDLMPLASALRERIEATPVSLGSRSRQFRGDIETIVAAATAADRSRRYQSAAELAADIRRHLDSQPITARPPGVLYQFSRFAKRNRGLVAGVAAAALSLVLGLIGTSAFAARSNRLLRTSEALLYTSVVDAASRALHRGDSELAFAQLERAPEHLRGWEWRHLEARSDTRVRRSTLGPGVTLPHRSDLVWKGCGDEFVITALTADDVVTALRVDARRLRVVDSVESVAVQRPQFGMASLDASGSTLFQGFASQGALDGQIVQFASREAESLHIEKPIHVPAGHVAIARRSGFLFAHVRNWRVIDRGSIADHDSLGLIAASRNRDSLDPSVLIINARTGETLRRLPFRGDASGPPIFAQGGRVVVLPSVRGTIQAFDVDTGQELAWSPLDLDPLETGLLVQAGEPSVILAGSNQGEILRIDTKTGAVTAARRGPPERVRAIGLRPSSGELFSVTSSGQISVWNDPEEDPLAMHGHQHWVDPIDLQGNGQTLVTGDWDASIRFWDVGSRTEIRELRMPPTGQRYTIIHDLDFSPKGDRLAVVWSGGWTTPHRVQEIDPETGGVLDDVVTITMAPTHASYHPDGRLFISSRREAATTPTQGAVHIGSAFSSVAHSPTRRRHSAVVVGDLEPGTLRVFDNETLDTICEGEIPWKPVHALAYSNDGSRLAVAGFRTVGIYDTRDCTPIGELRGHPDAIFDVAWSPSNERIATASRDGTVGIWDARSLRMITHLYGHDDFVNGIVWSPDGQELYSTSHDCTVRVWSAETPRSLRMEDHAR